MYALLSAKAKVPVNRRGCADGGRVRVTAAQAVQAQGQQRDCLRAPLCRRHTRRVVSWIVVMGCPLDIQTSGQCPNATRLLYRSVT
jgi:hypothetical protein